MALYSVSQKSQKQTRELNRRSRPRRNVIPFRKKYRRDHIEQRRAPRKIRKFVLERDNYTCQCCNRSDEILYYLTIHHIIHVQKGGDHDPKNLVTACVDCQYIMHTELGEHFPSGVDPREKQHLFENYNSLENIA